MVRILVVEPHADGHHANYLRWVVRAAVERGWSVAIATTTEALAHPSLAGISNEFPEIQIHLMPDIPRRRRFLSRIGRMQGEFQYRTAFKKTADEVRATTPVDAVFVPYLDYCFHALAILGSPFRELPWSGIAMRLSVCETRRRSSLPIKWRFAVRLLSDSTLTRLFVINPSIEDVSSEWGRSPSLSKLSYLPDPAVLRPVGERASARAALGIADGLVAILVFGSMDERKGITPLVRSIASQDGLDNYVVILAGKQSATVRDEIRAPPGAELRSEGRLIVIDRFLSDDEQALVFAAADVVWVGYRNHLYMSGVLVLAGMAGLPVVGTPAGEIGRSIAKYKLGITASDDPVEVRSALRTLLDCRTRTEMGQRARAAYQGHTVENFGAAVTAAFIRRTPVGPVRRSR